MKTIIEDTWFSADTKIRIGHGMDELVFRRCAFEGGDIFVEHDVDRPIFSECAFLGTNFSGQALSARIATRCHSAPGETEAAASEMVFSLHARFRR